MDPIYLKDSELEYELKIRGLKDLSTRRDKTGALREHLKREANGEEKGPSYCSPMFATDDEISCCLDLLRNIQVILKESFLNKDESHLTICEHRLLHLKARVTRIQPSSSIDENQIRDILSHTLHELSSLDEFRIAFTNQRKPMRHSLPRFTNNSLVVPSENIRRSLSDLYTSEVNQVSENDFSTRSTIAVASANNTIPTLVNSNHNIPTSVGYRMPNIENLIALSRLSTISGENNSVHPSVIPNIAQGRSTMSLNESLFDARNLSYQEHEDTVDEMGSELNPHASNFLPSNVNNNITVAFEDPFFRNVNEERSNGAPVRRARATIGRDHLNNITYAISETQVNRNHGSVLPNTFNSIRTNPNWHDTDLNSRRVPLHGRDTRINSRELPSNTRNHHYLDFPEKCRTR